MAVQYKDYYQILGVPRGASEAASSAPSARAVAEKEPSASSVATSSIRRASRERIRTAVFGVAGAADGTDDR